MKYLVGIDGGGSKTKGVLSDSQGNILAKVKGGPSNYHLIGLEKATNTLQHLIKKLVDEAEIEINQIAMIVAGLAGVDRPIDKSKMKKGLLDKLDLPNRTDLHFTNDLIIALYGAVKRNFGVVVNAGTGAIALGKNQQGEKARADGWGYLLGDGGSGFWLGLKAIKASLKAYDGRGPATSLQDSIKNYFSLDQIENIINLVYDSPQEELLLKISRLAPLVFKEAEKGDQVADNILQKGGKKLGHTACAVIQKLDLEDVEVPIVLLGGIFKNSYLDAFLEELQREIECIAPEAKFVDPLYPPVLGGLLLGAEKLGIQFPPESLPHTVFSE